MMTVHVRWLARPAEHRAGLEFSLRMLSHTFLCFKTKKVKRTLHQGKKYCKLFETNKRKKIELRSKDCYYPPLAGVGCPMKVNYQKGVDQIANSKSTPTWKIFMIEILPPPAGDNAHPSICILHLLSITIFLNPHRYELSSQQAQKNKRIFHFCL